ncbi:unnamed protein product [Bathycoccus prasinos]
MTTTKQKKTRLNKNPQLTEDVVFNTRIQFQHDDELLHTVYAVEILRDVAHTLKRNGESFIRHQRLASLKSEKFASELQAISNRANSSGIDIGNIEKNKKNYDLLNDVLHINGFLNAVSYSLNETSKEYGNFLDKFEHQLSDVVAKMELSFARKLKGAFDEHEKVFNQLAPCREKLAKLHQLPEEKQESPGKAKEIDRYEILENKRESQLKGTTSMLLDRCKCFLRENEPRVRMAIFAYKVAEYDTYVKMADSIKKIASEREDGIEELKKMVEEYEDTSKHAVPRLLPPKEERQDEQPPPSIEEPKTPEPKTPGIEDRKGGVHIQEEDEDEEDKEETVSSSTPSS